MIPRNPLLAGERVKFHVLSPSHLCSKLHSLAVGEGVTWKMVKTVH